jgi:hypothetical protein
MPWEIDYALLSFSQLKRSLYYLPKDINIHIDSCLNLSSYAFDWPNSKIPKEFFIEKYNTISILLEGVTHNKKIYEGDELYGHLDLQRDCISSEMDYYMSICPDINFSEHLLYYLIESARQIKNKYFVISPQVSKVGDADWDEITDPKYVNIPYSDYLNVDIFDVEFNRKNSNEEISLQPLKKSKWAGWFDLYNKALYEELCEIQSDWKGYGPWDLYSLIIMNNVKPAGVDVQQYLLRGETIWFYPTGTLLTPTVDGFSNYYRNFLKLKDNKTNQREVFESKLSEYLHIAFNKLKSKNII